MININKIQKIQDLLDEINSKEAQQKGFTDVYIKGTIDSKYQEDIDKWIINEGFKTILTQKVDRTSYISFDGRLRDICLDKTYIKHGILYIAYENDKKLIINVDNLNTIYGMRKGDNHVY